MHVLEHELKNSNRTVTITVLCKILKITNFKNTHILLFQNNLHNEEKILSENITVKIKTTT